MKRITFLCASALALAASFSGVAHAQSTPNNLASKPLRWLVPYPAGGGSDVLARTIGQQLSAQIGQPVLIDNKPGGNTALAAAETVRSAPDGTTVLSADNGTLVFNPALYKSLSYDPVKDLAPITLMGKFPMILVVAQDAPFKDARDFLAQAKAAPGKYSFGSAGAGSPHQLAMELLKVEAGLRIVHIPYRGAAPALQDLVGGQVQAMMVDLAAGKGFIQGNKIRALAVANNTRLAQLPDVPTFAELGYKNVEAAALVGLVAPIATPAPVIEALNKQVVAAINSPAVHKRMVDLGVEPVGNTPAQYTELLRVETTRWHKLIRDLNITLD